MTQRVSTGVKGLDKLVQGGVPKGSVVLVSGAPGTGKTILGMQFLEAGLRKGEKCAYVTIEEPPEKIMNQAAQFGFFRKPPEMISARDIRYDIGIGKKPEGIVDKVNLVLEKLRKLKPERVVIDSVSSLILEDGLKARVVVKKLIEGLDKLGATCVVTGEALEGDYPDEATPFLVDGVIVLTATEVGKDTTRNLVMRKMRQTELIGGLHELQFTKTGIKID